MSGTASLFFSPTGTTRKVVRAFAEGFGGERIENDITLPAGRSKALMESGENRISPISFADLAAAAESHKSSVDPGDIVKLRKYAAERDIPMPEEL